MARRHTRVPVVERRFSPLNLPLVTTVLAWGVNFVALKLTYPVISPPAVAVTRTLASWMILWAFIRWRGETLRVEPRLRGRIWAQGAVSMGLYMILFLEGMQRTSPAEGAIILATAPILTSLLGSLIGQERFRWAVLGGGLIAFVGVTMVVLGGDPSSHGSLLGNALVFASSVVWSVGVVMVRPLVQEVSPLRVLAISMPAGLLVLLPYGLMPTLHTDWAAVTPVAWWAWVHTALLAGAVATTTYYMGIEQIGVARAVMYQYFIPPTAAFFAWLALGSPFTLVQMLGVAVVVVGVASARTRSGSTTTSEEDTGGIVDAESAKTGT